MGEEETASQQPEETPVPDDQAPATADPDASSTPAPARPPEDGDDGGGIGPDVIFHG
jgi:hypothetical protein